MRPFCRSGQPSPQSRPLRRGVPHVLTTAGAANAYDSKASPAPEYFWVPAPCMGRSDPEVADIFSRYSGGRSSTGPLSSGRSAAMTAIERCQTSALQCDCCIADPSATPSRRRSTVRSTAQSRQGRRGCRRSCQMNSEHKRRHGSVSLVPKEQSDGSLLREAPCPNHSDPADSPDTAFKRALTSGAAPFKSRGVDRPALPKLICSVHGIYLLMPLPHDVISTHNWRQG